MVLCKEDIDCDPLNTNKLCYANLSRFESPTDSFGCACNTFYGWTGDDCTKFSLSTFYTLTVAGGVTIAGAYLSFQMIRVFVLSYKYEELWTSKFWTVVLNTFGAIGIWGWGLMTTLSTVTVGGGGIPVDPDKFADPYSGRWNFFSVFFGPVAVFGTALAAINVAIVWLDIAFRSRTLDRSQTRAYKYNRRFLVGFQISAIVISLGAFGYEKLSPDGTSIYGFAISLPVLAMVIWYTIGYNKFMPILQIASERNTGDPMIQTTKKIIKQTMARVIVGLVIYLIGVFVNSSLDTLGGSWKNFTEVGKIGAGKIFHHLQLISVAIITYAVYKYLVVLSTNGGFYLIIGVCNPEMVENPDYKGSKRNLGVKSEANSTQMQNGNTAEQTGSPEPVDQRKSNFDISANIEI